MACISLAFSAANLAPSEFIEAWICLSSSSLILPLDPASSRFGVTSRKLDSEDDGRKSSFLVSFLGSFAGVDVLMGGFTDSAAGKVSKELRTLDFLCCC
jgi:hypothetical protein